ncbi:telomere zinc finger-associated protein [Callorhinchus milii]|uniref:Zinc finger and BTB domain containing 48 n=1 Tax=Callorhinchus milii TaxID=7868 RepID=A0A4W3H1C0_CALMI|nr:telomere zinc finger-associated protein [Callorhinchus milii]XP_007900313.1 telomere zinc finger-associated protein [Callorhinchus milii]XP_042199471.1 telomere zinc finger-associated protein [Callorhinchus milii]XP_042199472.1 telomere zinc finger-associated protein [Callorhinchus milii]XP_042199473.1 telomere zinc finger-associated protein [Callorhinchus milii]XP_042199474.1 telomere zinc finger-associated protein [Callorhinchus milii]|eukprot:gi/632968042/ref/XP_007900312.1/ PREDICTED: zinc finger and BTB domain-containing protein 48 [Callorhinchus milii]
MEDYFAQHSKKILNALNKQREEGTFCDVTLDVEGRCLRAHRSILSCCSRFFHGVYRQGMSADLQLPQSCTGVLALLFDFIYTGDLRLTRANVCEVLSAAEELCIPDAVQMCRHYQQSLAGNGEGSVSPGEGGTVNGPSATKPEAGEAVTLNRPTSKYQLRHQRAERCGRTGRVQLPTERERERVKASGERNRDGECVVTQGELVPDQTNDAGEGGRVECEQNGLGSVRGGSDGAAPEMDLVKEEDKEDEGEMDERDEVDDDYVPIKHSYKKRKRPTLLRAAAQGPEGQSLGDADPANAKSEPVECPTCHKTFLSKYYLKVHNRKHTGEKPFKCSKCGKCYFRKENLLKHEARNCLTRADVIYTCPECKETFKGRIELRKHVVSHTGEMPYKCLSCPHQFMQKRDLQSHMIKSHGAPKPHGCPACSKRFLSRNELHLHEASKHQGERLFMCEECGHRASSRYGLQMHINSKHRNERPYVCEYCNHAFTQKGNLNVHRRTHTGEKPFQCHFCGKTFRIQASLDKHNRTHTGERPFSCEICQQKFTERGPLHRHVASKHQEGRPHYCNICNKTFKAIDQLRVHVGRHRGMRKFECSECGYKFTRQAHLRRHMDIHGRVENYNPRQRRLRNLVVSGEGTGDQGVLSASEAGLPAGASTEPAPQSEGDRELSAENQRDAHPKETEMLGAAVGVEEPVSLTETYVEESPSG